MRDQDQLIWWRGYDRGKEAGFGAGIAAGMLLMGLVAFIFIGLHG